MGISYNERRKMMDTRLHQAVVRRDMAEVVELSLEKPWLVTTEDEFGRLPIHLAAYSGDADITKYLLELEPESAVHKDESRFTALEYAIKQDHEHVVEMIAKFVKEQRR